MDAGPAARHRETFRYLCCGIGEAAVERRGQGRCDSQLEHRHADRKTVVARCARARRAPAIL